MRMLEILEDLYILYFFMRKYTSVPYIGGISVRYKQSSITISVLYK